MKHVMRIVLIGLAGLLIWRITVLGVAQHYAERMLDGDSAAADKARAWYPHQIDAALRAVTQHTPEGRDAIPIEQITAISAGNPADPRPLLALAKRAEEDGDNARAQALLERAVRLYPANAPVHKIAALFWARNNNLARALQHWSIALQAQPADQRTLFPLFLEIAENTQTRGFLSVFATAPPTWWDGFFQTVARRAIELETVRTLYAMRRNQPDAPLSQKERAAYIQRLQKDNQITEAYLVWVNGLDEAGRNQLGNINNGGFELEPTNLGFDWHISRTNHVKVSTAKTFGVAGEKALHLIFKRRESPYHHLYQPLFLDPAFYRLRGMVRTDSLDSIGGLKWVVRCTNPETEILAETNRFLGTGEWSTFSVDFPVTDTCLAQEIRLMSAGRRPFEQKISGGIWFDAMTLRKIPNPQKPTDP